MAWVNQETPALDEPAIEYVIDGDREFRELEAKLQQANEQNDGHAIAVIHGQLDTLDAGPSAPVPPHCCTGWDSHRNSWTPRYGPSPEAGGCA